MAVRAGTHFGHPFKIFGTEIGAAAHGEHIGQAREFVFDLIETVRVADEEQHAAFDAARERHAEDGFEIETAVGENRGDASHGARMILDAELEHSGWRRLASDGGGTGRSWHDDGPASRVAQPGQQKPPRRSARGGN